MTCARMSPKKVFKIATSKKSYGVHLQIVNFHWLSPHIRKTLRFLLNFKFKCKNLQLLGKHCGRHMYTQPNDDVAIAKIDWQTKRDINVDAQRKKCDGHISIERNKKFIKKKLRER